jgi:hypothetical protein
MCHAAVCCAVLRHATDDNSLNLPAILDTAIDVARAMLHLHRNQVCAALVWICGGEGKKPAAPNVLLSLTPPLTPPHAAPPLDRSFTLTSRCATFF